MATEQPHRTTLEQQLKNALPLDSTLRRALRRAKNDLNELLWTVKPDWPQLGASPELGQLRMIGRDQGDLRPAPDGKRILIFSMRSWRIHKIWEGLIGRGLLERGAEPTVLICDGLPRCDMFRSDMAGYSSHRCTACMSYTRQLFHLFGLPVRRVSEFVPPSTAVEAQGLVASWHLYYPSFEANDLPIGELVQPSVMRTLLRGSLESDPASLRLYKEYLEAGVIIGRSLEGALATLEPDTLMMLNGMFFAERIGLALAQQRQLHSVTHERGFMRNRLVLAHDEPANWFRVDDAWPSFAGEPLTAHASARLDEYLRARTTGQGEVVNYWPSAEARHEYVVEQLRLDWKKPILTAFTNILWDTAVYKRDLAFDGMFDWLETTIEQVSDLPALQLVIRIHPAEVRLPRKTRERVLDRLAERFPTLPENVVIVSPESAISSYALADLSTAVTVYTSTIGLEAALRGIPVIVAGQTHYRGKGFTIDVGSPDHYRSLLTELPTWGRSAGDTIVLSRRYAYLFFLRNMLPVDLVTEHDSGSVEFNFESFDALKPGQHRMLDHICTAILEKKSFVLHE